MRVQADSCVPKQVVDDLRAEGHDVTWCNEWPSDPGDEQVLATAHAEQRVLVTLDKDFGEYAIALGLPHSGLIRLVSLPIAMQAERCAHVLRTYEKELLASSVITVDWGRIRIRPSD